METCSGPARSGWPGDSSHLHPISQVLHPAGALPASLSPEASRKSSGNSLKGVVRLFRPGKWPPGRPPPGQAQPRAPKGLQGPPRVQCRPLTLSPGRAPPVVARPPQSRCLEPSEGTPLRGQGWSWQVTGRASEAKGRRSPTVVPSPWSPGAQPMTASLCHSPRHRSAPRRRLAQASPQLPPPGLGCPPRNAPSRWEDSERREREGSAAGRSQPEPLLPSRGVSSVLGVRVLHPPHCPPTCELSSLGCTPRTSRRWFGGSSVDCLAGVFSGGHLSLSPLPPADRSPLLPGTGPSQFPAPALGSGRVGVGQARAGL